jgi:hypothetical protein
VVAVLLLALPLATFAAEQKNVRHTEAAVDALMAALKADDDAAIVALFGDQYKDLVVTTDRAANSATRAKILAAMQTMRVLDERGADKRVVLIGDQAWPMPIPLVKDKGAWRFATAEGADELVNRRSAATSASAIHVLRAYLDAQRQIRIEGSRRRQRAAVRAEARQLARQARRALLGRRTQPRARRRARSGRSSPRARTTSRGTRRAIRTAATASRS